MTRNTPTPPSERNTEDSSNLLRPLGLPPQQQRDRGGRPFVLTPQVADALCTHLAADHRVLLADALASVGVSVRTWQTWRRVARVAENVAPPTADGAAGPGQKKAAVTPRQQLARELVARVDVILAAHAEHRELQRALHPKPKPKPAKPARKVQVHIGRPATAKGLTRDQRLFAQVQMLTQRAEREWQRGGKDTDSATEEGDGNSSGLDLLPEQQRGFWQRTAQERRERAASATDIWRQDQARKAAAAAATAPGTPTRNVAAPDLVLGIGSAYDGSGYWREFAARMRARAEAERAAVETTEAETTTQGLEP
jgi:hypothetical protein